MANRIYIGNLPYTISATDLRKELEGLGLQVREIKVVTDRDTGQGKGFGFADFDTVEAASDAISKVSQHNCRGRVLRADMATERAPRSGGGGGGSAGVSKRSFDDQAPARDDWGDDRRGGGKRNSKRR